MAYLLGQLMRYSLEPRTLVELHLFAILTMPARRYIHSVLSIPPKAWPDRYCAGKTARFWNVAIAPGCTLATLETNSAMVPLL